MQICLSCDCGDGLVDDDSALPFANAAHIACGALSLGAQLIDHCLQLCRQHGVQAGASPSTMSHANIGQRIAIMAPEHIAATVRTQLLGLLKIAALHDMSLTHVRLQGTLHQFAATDTEVAAAVADSIAGLDAGLMLIGPAGSHLISAGRRAKLQTASEIAADRQYEPDGMLRGRSLPGAVFRDAAQCAEQIVSVLEYGYAVAHDGTRVYLDADVAFVHDSSRIGAIKRALTRAGVRCGPLLKR